MAIILISVYILAKKGKVVEGASLLLVIFTALITFLMWRYSGIRDEAILGYLCVLLMTAIIGNRKFFIALLSFISLSIMLNALSNSQNWYVNIREDVTINSGIFLVILLLLISYVIWILASDFHSILNKLKDKNDKLVGANLEIKKFLFHDILTGLPNRIKAKEEFDRAVLQAESSHKKVGLLFVDIDKFKALNDSLGHQSGDELLVQFSRRLQRYASDEAYLFRTSGDQFLAVFHSVQSEEYVAMRIQEILNDLNSNPFLVMGDEYTLRCSVGIAITPNDGADFDDIIKKADAAMNRSKSLGGNCFHFFDANMDILSQDYIHIVNDLRKAIRDDEFVLYFQPKIDLKTNRIIGAESLIRWQHPSKGLIFPDGFIKQAEDSGLIIEIGDWVLQESCRVCKSWIDQGLAPLTIAVNISPQQFKRENLSEIVNRALSISQLPPDYLDLEMTESLLIDKNSDLKESITLLNGLGVSFSIDDFGTGYSNLGYIQEFEVKSLKIDKSFIQDMQLRHQSKGIVVAIIQMAKSIGLISVAEGIEDNETMTLLFSLGCDLAQGYYWSKPVPNEDFIKFVKNHA